MKKLMNVTPFVVLLFVVLVFGADISARARGQSPAAAPGKVSDIPRPNPTGSNPKPEAATAAVATMTGKTFRDVREEILMATVRCLFVSDSALAVKELSQRVGYKSATSFARAIRRACGLCPEELRFRVVREEILAMRIPEHVA